ncbi:MAG TPA: type II secretion system F family protein [Burkholderiales bacterium]|nr:type II secretion system F family protein [Burkholderiales bacterium]
MPAFIYTALSPNGARVEEEAVADSEGTLRNELVARGLLVQKIKPKRSGLQLPERRVKPEEFALFNQEFMALVRAGLTIPDGLALAANRPDSPVLGKTLGRVYDDVRNGAPLSEACARYPETFDRLYVATIRTGEKTGDVVKVLARYQDYLRHRIALRKKLSQALAYPAFLLIALVLILVVLFTFVMPRFVAMYADLGAALPLPTRVLLGIVEYLYIVGPAVIGLVVLAVIAWKRLIANEAGRRRVDQVKERLPYIGGLQRIVSAAQLSRSLSTLLAGGTPLVEALRTAASSIANQVYLDKLAVVIDQVVGGSSLAKVVRSTGLMPEMAARMIEVGEASGGLETMLAEIAQFYEEVLDNRLARVMALIEPLLMLIMGVLIGGIIIIMYLPVFHMADIIK